MDDLTCFAKHFNAICVILGKYQSNETVRSFPARLPEILEASTQLHLLKNDQTHVHSEFMDLLDDTTAILGKIGDGVSPADFEKLKFHYGNLQVAFSQHCAESKKKLIQNVHHKTKNTG